MAAAPAVEPVYRLKSVQEQEQFTSEKGELLFTWCYQTLELEIVNLSELTGQGLYCAQRNRENFNEEMREGSARARASSRQVAESASLAAEQGYLGSEYIDETTTTAVFQGQVISVRADNYNYFGGAHPKRHSASFIFDLGTGQFVDPAALADDPAAFQRNVAMLLIGKVEEDAELLANCWTDYADTLFGWNEEAAVFISGDGVTVHYSPYDLAPYAVGDVEFTFSWQELALLLGRGGMDKLGLT